MRKESIGNRWRTTDANHAEDQRGPEHSLHRSLQSRFLFGKNELHLMPEAPRMVCRVPDLNAMQSPIAPMRFTTRRGLGRTRSA
jgi:hypothetical protein